MAETVDTEVKKDVNTQDKDYEALASDLGWVPKDKFRGDPEKHVDAKTYWEKGELVLPIVKKQRDDAKKEAEKLARDLAEVKSTIGEFQKFTQAAAERQVAELKNEIAALKDARAAAVAAGDDKAFRAAEDAIEDKKEDLDKAKEKPAEKQVKIESDPEFDAWKKENPWYDADTSKKEFADQLGIYLHQVKKMPRSEVLLAVAKRVAELDAETSGTERPGPQRGGKPTGNNSKAKTFDNLVPEFKTGFAKLTKAGFSITKEQYVAQCGPEAWGQ